MIIIAKISPVAQVAVFEGQAVAVDRTLAYILARHAYAVRADIAVGAGIAVVALRRVVIIRAEPARPTLLACIVRADVAVVAFTIPVAGECAVFFAPVTRGVVAIVALLHAVVYVAVTAGCENARAQAIIRVVVIGVVAIFTGLHLAVPARGKRTVVPALVRVHVVSVIAPLAGVRHSVTAVGETAVPPACVRLGVAVIVTIIAFLSLFDDAVAAQGRCVLFDYILLLNIDNIDYILQFFPLFAVPGIVFIPFAAAARVEQENRKKY